MRLTAVGVSLSLIFVLTAFDALAQKNVANAHGRVCDFWGDGLEGAEVKFYRIVFENGLIVSAQGELERAATTDASGNYAVSGLTPGQYRITADLRGFRHTELRQLYLAMGVDMVIDIGLEVGLITTFKPVEVKGKVLQLDRTPLQDTTVTILSPANHQTIQQGRSDKTGHYRLELNAPGQYLVYASKPGFKVSVTTILSSSGNLNAVDFVLTLMPQR